MSIGWTLGRAWLVPPLGDRPAIHLWLPPAGGEVGECRSPDRTPALRRCAALDRERRADVLRANPAREPHASTRRHPAAAHPERDGRPDPHSGDPPRGGTLARLIAGVDRRRTG